MARKKTETATKEPEDSVIISAAKAVGTAAGKIASLAGATVGAQRAKPKKPKLAKKNKSRLPRREKKARQSRKA